MGTELKRSIGPVALFLFVIGDVLGTGIYALIGNVAAEARGLAWVSFAIAFGIATITALSYLELSTRFPLAAGSALYTHKAFASPGLTFLVGFAVVCGAIASASTGAVAFTQFVADLGGVPSVVVALLFLVALTGSTLLGIGESMRLNVALTLVELGGLVLVIVVSALALSGGMGDLSRLATIETSGDRHFLVGLAVASSLAFFAMLGFEDAVNMAEESTNPVRDFPRVMLSAMGVAGVIYVLVTAGAVALVPVDRLAGGDHGSALTQVVAAAAPGLADYFPFIGICSVANTALLNILTATRLLYGMSRQGVLPASLGWVHPARRTPWVAGLVVGGLSLVLVGGVWRWSGPGALAQLGGTSSLLILAVFTVVNVALIRLRHVPSSVTHFHAPRWAPWVGTLLCLALIGPWARDRDEYMLAALLIVVGCAMWLVNRSILGASKPSS